MSGKRIICLVDSDDDADATSLFVAMPVELLVRLVDESTPVWRLHQLRLVSRLFRDCVAAALLSTVRDLEWYQFARLNDVALRLLTGLWRIDMPSPRKTPWCSTFAPKHGDITGPWRETKRVAFPLPFAVDSLCRLRALHTLCLNDYDITDAALGCLTQLTALRLQYVPNVTSAGLAPLTRLRELVFDELDSRNNHLWTLTTLGHHLTRLDMGLARATKTGLCALTRLEQLTCSFVPRIDTPNHLTHLVCNGDLRHHWFHCRPVWLSGLRVVVDKAGALRDPAMLCLTNLHTLNLHSNNHITDASLSRLTQLTDLHLYRHRNPWSEPEPLVTDHSIACLTALRRLNIENQTTVTVVALRNLTNLRSFVFREQSGLDLEALASLSCQITSVHMDA